MVPTWDKFPGWKDTCKACFHHARLKWHTFLRITVEENDIYNVIAYMPLPLHLKIKIKTYYVSVLILQMLLNMLLICSIVEHTLFLFLSFLRIQLCVHSFIFANEIFTKVNKNTIFLFISDLTWENRDTTKFLTNDLDINELWKQSHNTHWYCI